MKAIIKGVFCGLLFTAVIISAFGANESKSSPADSLRSVSKADLITRAVELVRLADAAERQSLAVQAVKVVVELNPDATIEAVKSVCEVSPAAAPEIAAAAARLQPGKVAGIGQAAAKVAPDKAASIVLALCNQVPGQFRSIAAGVARVVPSAAKDILLSVAAAIPDLKASIDRVLFSSAAPVTLSVESTIAQAERVNSLTVSPIVLDSKAPEQVVGKTFGFFGWYFPRIVFRPAPPQWFWWPHFRPPPINHGPPPFPWFPWFPHPGGGHHGGGGHDYCAP